MAVLDYIIIIIIGIVIYRLIRRTEALKIALGLLVIVVVYLIADLVGLSKTAFLMKKMLEIMTVGLVVIFHPELRMALKKIGGITDIPLNEKMELVSIIEESVFSLAENKIGALIIFDPERKLTYRAENMVEIDAVCSKELIETIFHPNTALHDGAVIIHNDKIAFAGCKLPLSGKKREDLGHMGTRHLAAIESAETFDVTAIVVSEETGNVSVATNKGIYRVKSSAMFRSFFKEKITKKKFFKKFRKKF
jgi:diadenylate cyclase